MRVSLNIDPMTSPYEQFENELRCLDVQMSDFMEKPIAFQVNDNNLWDKGNNRERNDTSCEFQKTRDGRGNMKTVSDVSKRTTLTTFNTAAIAQEKSLLDI